MEWEAGVAHEDSGAEVAIPRLRPRPTWLAVHRVDLSVYYRRIEREEFQTLAALRSGSTLGDAIDAGFAGSRIAQRKRPECVQQWFGNWAELGWICALELHGLIFPNESARLRPFVDRAAIARSSMSALVRSATVAYGGMRSTLKHSRARCCSPSASTGAGSSRQMAGASCITSIASASISQRSTFPCRTRPRLFVSVLEFVGGIFLAAGLATRLTALVLFVNMTVAFWTAEKPAFLGVLSNPDHFKAPTPYNYWFAALLIMILGPGLFALDTPLALRFSRPAMASEIALSSIRTIFR